MTTQATRANTMCSDLAQLKFHINAFGAELSGDMIKGVQTMHTEFTNPAH